MLISFKKPNYFLVVIASGIPVSMRLIYVV